MPLDAAFLNRTQRRISAAILAGRLQSHELAFLQRIDHRFDIYRENAFLTDGQLRWLFTLLKKVETSRATISPPSQTLLEAEQARPIPLDLRLLCDPSELCKEERPPTPMIVKITE